MSSDGLPVDRLRDYLRELKPEARALLMAALDRGASEGGGVPGADLVLRELRSIFTDASELGDTDPSRLFFEPLGPFLVDDAPAAAQQGFVPRDVLEPVWNWLCRDLVPREAKAFTEEVARFTLRRDSASAERMTRAFQDRVVHCLDEALNEAEMSEKTRGRLSVQIGAPHALGHVREILAILRARDALALIGSRLPAQIRNLSDEQLHNVKAILESPVARNPHVLPYAVILVMSRLGARWQLIRLAISAAETDVAARVADSGLAIAVSVVLGDVARMVGRLRRELKSGHMADAAGLLKGIHDAARGLRTELDLSVDCPWARQLAAVRADVSQLLRAEIDGIPGRVRRLLRPRPAKEIAPGSEIDASEIADTQSSLELLGACRAYAAELAMNEVAVRVYSELQNYFDANTATLLDSLRNAGESDRPFRKSQADAAVCFTGTLFGPQHATLLAKAADVAAQGDRKAARA